MTIRKSSLLAATASVALLAIPPTGAFAFDVVDWEWTKLVDENVNINITIEDNFDTTGMVQVEKLQMHFGDIEANAYIDGVHNNPPGEAGDGTFEGVVSVDVDYDVDELVDGENDPINATLGAGGDIDTVEFHLGNGPVGTFSAGTGGFSDNMEIFVSGTVDLQDAAVLDAVDLPSVENAATAVANNQDIYSNVPVYLHDAQIAAGDINALDGEFGGPDGGPDALAFFLGAVALTEVDDELEGLNAHTDIAALTILGAATGFVESADITANAYVSDILNATVDNSATAVTNNMSVTLEALQPNDAVMIADITQVGIADVTANAELNSCDGECGDPAVEINNYANIGGAGLGPLGDVGPIVSNAATAVGNNLNITVNGPAVGGGT
jgi:hypothetical protein